MATWPSTKAGTTHLDSGTDSPRLARLDILQNVQNVNEIIDMFNISSPNNNQILKYNTSNSRFELADTVTGAITFVGDDSSGSTIDLGETLKITGTQNITTAIVNDVLTITGPDLTSYITASSTDTLTNKSGNISQWTNDSGYVTSVNTDLINDTTPQLGGNLDLNSNNITGTGSISITGDISTDAISIADNKITTTRSNDNLKIETNGSGRILVGDTLDGESGPWSTAGSNVGNQLHYRDTAYTPSNGSSYPNSRTAAYTLSADSSSGNRIRMMDAIDVETSGYSLTSASNGSGIQIGHLISVANSTASTSQLTKVQGNTSGVLFLGSGGQGTLDIGDLIAYRSLHQLSAASGDTIDIDNAYGYFHTPVFYAGNGATTTFTNEYGFYMNSGTTNATNTYAFYNANTSADYLLYTEGDTVKSRVGTLERYRERVISYTDDSSTAITIDCDASPVSKITLNNSMDIVFDNIAEGQSHTIIITNGGSNTASFYSSTSTAVKFAGGTPTISSGSGKIDVVTVFNDGTNLIGNIAKDYS